MGCLAITEDDIRKYLSGILVAPISLYEVKVRRGSDHFLIEVALDNLENKYGSVSVGNCTDVSRALTNLLDTEKPEINYTLRVSSAGAERNLKLPQELERFKGIPLKLEYKNEEGNLISGIFKVLEVSNGEVSLELYKRGSKKQQTLILKVDTILRGNIYIDI